MFPMTITLTNQAQLEAVMAVFGVAAPAAPAAPATPAAPAAHHTTATTASQNATSSQNATQIDFDTLKTAFLRLAKENRPAAEGVLKQFGVAKLTELQEAQYPDAYGATMAALG